MVRATAAALLLAAASAAAAQIPEATAIWFGRTHATQSPKPMATRTDSKRPPPPTPPPRGGFPSIEREFKLQTATSALQGLDVLEVHPETPGRKLLDQAAVDICTKSRKIRRIMYGRQPLSLTSRQS